MKEHFAEFKTMPIFFDLCEEDLASMLQCLGAYTRNYKKSELIFLEGDSLNHIGVVIHGEVQMIKEGIWGTKSILALIRKGGVFGETFVCGNSAQSCVSFQANSECTVLFLSLKKVLRSCNQSCFKHHQLIENMVTLIAKKNMQLLEKLEILSKKTIREKILTYLSQHVQTSGKHYFTSPMGRLELADYLCVDRSALTRELAHMKAEGLLDYDKNTFLLKPSHYTKKVFVRQNLE